MGASQGGVF